LQLREPRERIGLKGPRAAEWLASQGTVLPELPNTWAPQGAPNAPGAPLVARLGSAEFFLEDAAAGTSVRQVAQMVQAGLPGVYPVLREDWAFLLAGSEVHGMLAEVSSVDFAALALDLRPLVMTSMAGVGVLVVPQALAGERRYRIWCDPSFGPYLCETLGAVVVDCGGTYRGAAV
jgi:sarcosine oxidase subunit gamma